MEGKEPQEIAFAIGHCPQLPGYAKTIDPLPRRSASRQDRLPTQPSIAVSLIPIHSVSLGFSVGYILPVVFA